MWRGLSSNGLSGTGSSHSLPRAREYVDQYLLKHEFIKRLHDRYRREGITIPFPIRTIVRRDPSVELRPQDGVAQT
jgi:small-conductance mechanosensitive channel